MFLFPFDLDLAMVNQIMHTFTWQKGYFSNNITSENWSWHKDAYELKSNQLFSIKDLYQFFSHKLGLVFGCLFGFALISCLNGLVVRVALISSNVVIVPILWVMKKCFGIRESDRNIQVIYHSMGVIGAQIADIQRNKKSKVVFSLAVVAVLLLTYYVQTCCYFVWVKLMFPASFASNLNDLYFFYSNLLEFTFFIFIRTRLSLKYYSKVVTLINLVFFVYINSYLYSAQLQIYRILLSTNLLFFITLLLEFEIPALRDWNPFDLNTPS